MNRPDSFGFAMEFLGEPEASELLAYIQELEKAQGEWISVDDKEPETSGRYTVFDGIKTVGSDWYQVLEASPMYDGWISGCPTHWKPLPTPPTE